VDDDQIPPSMTIAETPALENNSDNNIPLENAKKVVSFRLDMKNYNQFVEAAKFLHSCGVIPKPDIVTFIRFCLAYYYDYYMRAKAHFERKEAEEGKKVEQARKADSFESEVDELIDELKTMTDDLE